MRKQQAHALNLELGPRSYKALLEIQEKTESRSKVDVIRLALQVLDKIVNEIETGGRVVVEKENGIRVEIMIPGAA